MLAEVAAVAELYKYWPHTDAAQLLCAQDTRMLQSTATSSDHGLRALMPVRQWGAMLSEPTAPLQAARDRQSAAIAGRMLWRARILWKALKLVHACKHEVGDATGVVDVTN